ncbi:MAG: shikimate kinase [Planctomycetota bacterium]|nr:shikimate kinase [Planctomycetota bacterium]
MNLVLIGYRCAGKTTIGRLLAGKLGWPLVDTDTLIQERAGKSIKEIVAAGGWPEFRRLEREVIADVAAGDRQVISAGGGAILDEVNRKALRAGGRVVLLTAAPETIWQRMKADPKTLAERPNLTDAGGIAEVRKVLAEREAAYQAACHYAVSSDRLSPDEAAARILEWFKESGQ